MKKIRKAVFPVAGFGTRFLPVTKAMPKELLPIVDKPLIQYAAEEAIAAGIDTLIFVTGRNKRAIEDHFDSNYELENLLRSKGKHKKANMVRNIVPKGVECIFIRQAEQLGLGHAILCAERVVGNDPFAVLLADDFIIDSGNGVTSDLIKAFEKNGKSQLSVMQVDEANISNYGIVKQDPITKEVVGLIEKPAKEHAPSRIASIGRYVLTHEIFQILKATQPGANNEIQLADAIHEMARQGKFQMQHLNGKRFDCGSTFEYVAAINHVFGQKK